MGIRSQKTRKKHGRMRPILLESLKWLLVLYLLWPIVRFREGAFPLVRLLLGILLFIIFSGKLFYDLFLADVVRQRRPTLKQDLCTLAGMILAVLLLIGAVVAMVAAMLVAWQKSLNAP
ncbi:hypothetical protein JW906_00930 [bacterium]|nr:hypothetical protein [bacterium]